MPSASGVVSGNKVVASAGTQERLVAQPAACSWIVITAAPANAGNITIGASDVDATADAEAGITLDAGQSTPVLPVNNASLLWVDATNSGDEVGYIYGTVAG
jgi:hypothetical protein